MQSSKVNFRTYLHTKTKICTRRLIVIENWCKPPQTPGEVKT